MDDERDWIELPRIDGFGCATTLAEYSEPRRVKRKRRIGFHLPKASAGSKRRKIGFHSPKAPK